MSAWISACQVHVNHKNRINFWSAYVWPIWVYMHAYILLFTVRSWHEISFRCFYFFYISPTTKKKIFHSIFRTIRFKTKLAPKHTLNTTNLRKSRLNQIVCVQRLSTWNSGYVRSSSIDKRHWNCLAWLYRILSFKFNLYFDVGSS